MASFEYGFCATQGQRNYQEDAAAIWPSQLVDSLVPEATFDWNVTLRPEVSWNGMVVVLADGMGGHAGGALASRTVCRSFIESWLGIIAGANASGRVSEDMHTHLLKALTSGNTRIRDIVKANPALSGMGSTLIGVILCERGLEWISVGDSPLYLYREQQIALLNEDHSLAPALNKLVHEGKISPEQAKNDPRRHMLRSAVNGEDIDLIDVSRNPLHVEPGDYIIAASDGIHTLDEGELCSIICALSSDGPHAVSAAIVRAIDNAGDPHQDNATVIAVRTVG